MAGRGILQNSVGVVGDETQAIDVLRVSVNLAETLINAVRLDSFKCCGVVLNGRYW